MVHEGEEHDGSGLHDLPIACLATLVDRLTFTDVLALRRTSSGLKSSLDTLWEALCERDFGAHTDPAAWLDAAAGADASPSVSASEALYWAPQPHTYRELYPELLRHQPLPGFWTGVGAGPRGALYRFRWAPDGVEILQYGPTPCFRRRLPLKTAFRLGPGSPRLTFSVLEPSSSSGGGGGSSSGAGRSCIVREQRAPPRRGTNRAAEAAAAVAAGGGHSSPGAPPLGASPPSSFGFELLQFMQSNVAPGRSRNRSRLSGGGGGGGGGPAGLPPPVLHHFAHLPVPQPTRQHPLAGLWTAMYGPHGLEVLAVSYDFSGSAAVIKATKMLGDPNVPAGEVSWVCSAAPIAQPWPDDTVALVARRGWFHQMSEAAAQHWRHPGGGSSDDGSDEEEGGNAPAGAEQQEGGDEEERRRAAAEAARARARSASARRVRSARRSASSRATWARGASRALGF